MIWWLLAALLVVTPLLLYLAGRRSERATMKDWELILTPHGETVYQEMKGKVHADLALSSLAYQRAARARHENSIEEALRFLDIGCRLVEDFAPSMIRSLAAMAVLSRMVSAMVPMRSLRPKAFQVRQLVNLAYLNGFIHNLLVTAAERFRLRVYILSRGFSVATRLLFRSERLVAEHPQAAVAEWDQIEALQRDIHTLSDESIESFRMLLASLNAERKEL
jgi:hypothetical protein